MTTITFDTLELVEKLKTAGVSQEQAEAVVRVIAEAQNNLLTKNDLEITLSPIKTDLAVLRSDSITIKWMIGFLIACALSVIVKSFI